MKAGIISRHPPLLAHMSCYLDFNQLQLIASATRSKCRPCSSQQQNNQQRLLYKDHRCILSCPVLPCPVLSCPVLSCPALSCLVLSCPVQAAMTCLTVTFCADEWQPASQAEAGHVPAAGPAPPHAAPHLQPCPAQRGLLRQDPHEGARPQESQKGQGRQEQW